MSAARMWARSRCGTSAPLTANRADEIRRSRGPAEAGINRRTGDVRKRPGGGFGTLTFPADERIRADSGTSLSRTGVCATAGVRQDAGVVRDNAANVSAGLTAAQAGDEEGFRVLYRDMQPRLLRYLRVLVGEDAEDVASETWLQIARDLATFHGDLDGFRGWATTIGRRRALDHLRRQQRRPVTGEPFEALTGLPANTDTAEAALDAIDTERALALIASLPVDQAEAVMLRVVVGLDAKTAAEVLGKRPGAVRMSAYRGLARLAERVEECEGWGVTRMGAAALKEVK